MDFRTRLTNWALPALLLGLPLLAALALEHASAAGMKERSSVRPAPPTQIQSPKPAPRAALPKAPETTLPATR